MSDPLRTLHQPQKRLIGMNLRMSLRENRTRELWSSFMPARSAIDQTISSDLFSVQVYDNEVDFSPDTIFTKWACMEVGDTTEIPDGMDELIIPSGEYAVFMHRGPAHEFPETLEKVMNWMHDSGREFDARPQYEVLPVDYPGPASPEAEEEVWIPIKSK
jgi:AraC family transcriptional regulator